MSTSTFALLVSLNTLIAIVAVWVAVKTRRDVMSLNGPLLPHGAPAPQGATFHDAALLAALLGLLIHGDTENRSPAYISRTALQIADEVTKARRTA